MNKVLLIAPLLDVPTVTSNLATLEILDWIDNRTFDTDIDIDYLTGIIANKLFYNLKVWKKKYDLILYYGHGYSDKLMGNHIYISLINTKNIYKLKGTGISSMACFSADRLGKVAINEGVKAYIGTITPYWAAFPENYRNFTKDWIDYTTIKDKMLLTGHSFGEAINAFKNRAAYYLNIYEKYKDYESYNWYIDSIKSNIQNTILLGDKDYCPMQY